MKKLLAQVDASIIQRVELLVCSPDAFRTIQASVIQDNIVKLHMPRYAKRICIIVLS